MKYNKLVRDRIPEIIEGKGEKAVFHIAEDEEYHAKLLEKLREEVEEFVKEENSEELADILEILYTLAESHGVSREELEQKRKEKEDRRGGFARKIILDETL